MTMPSTPIQLILPVFLLSLSASCSDNEIEYTGILEHRPEGKDGIWVISGQSFSVTEDVELDEDHGLLKAGACIELEVEHGDVKEIESVEITECQSD